MKRGSQCGENIKYYRELAGLSKSELARRVKVSPTAVSNWEDNGVMPRAELFYDLGKALEVDFVDLMGHRSNTERSRQRFSDDAVVPQANRSERLEELKAEIANLFGVTATCIEVIVRT